MVSSRVIGSPVLPHGTTSQSIQGVGGVTNELPWVLMSPVPPSLPPISTRVVIPIGVT